MLSRQLPLWLAVLVLIVSAPCAQASKGQVTADRYVGNEAEIGIVTINQSSLSVSGDIIPKGDNVSTIGSPSLRYKAVYTRDIYTGDLKFANGWVLTEAENLGLGRGIVLVSPDGEVYGVGDLKYCNKGVPLTHAVTYAVTGLLAGLGIGAGAAAVNKKLRK